MGLAILCVIGIDARGWGRGRGGGRGGARGRLAGSYSKGKSEKNDAATEKKKNGETSMNFHTAAHKFGEKMRVLAQKLEEYKKMDDDEKAAFCEKLAKDYPKIAQLPKITKITNCPKSEAADQSKKFAMSEAAKKFAAKKVAMIEAAKAKKAQAMAHLKEKKEQEKEKAAAKADEIKSEKEEKSETAETKEKQPAKSEEGGMQCKRMMEENNVDRRARMIIFRNIWKVQMSEKVTWEYLSNFCDKAKHAKVKAKCQKIFATAEELEGKLVTEYPQCGDHLRNSFCPNQKRRKGRKGRKG